MDWRYFAAGGICAATSHGITTPIDVVKTRMQQNPEKYSKGVIAAAKDIVATEGVGFLLAGLGAMTALIPLCITVSTSIYCSPFKHLNTSLHR